MHLLRGNGLLDSDSSRFGLTLSTDGSADGLLDAPLHAAGSELAAVEAESTVEGDAAGLSSLGGREGNGGLESLGSGVVGRMRVVVVLLGVLLMVFLVLLQVLWGERVSQDTQSVESGGTYMDTEGDESGAGDMASKDLVLAIVVGQLAILGELKGDGDGAILDVVRVDDVGFAGGQRRVEADAGKVIGKRKLDGGGGVGHRDTDDGVPLPGEVGVELWAESAGQRCAVVCVIGGART